MRLARRVGLVMLLAALAWLSLVIRPQPLFAHELRRDNVVLHARVPLEPKAGPWLDEVVRRVARSPLYDPERLHHVFLCDTPELFAFFEPFQRNVGGIAQWHLGGNVFIRPFNLERGTVIGPAGKEKTGERDLVYFIAHEVTHVMTSDRIGRWRYAHLAAFQVEGYADYVAFARPVDFAAAQAALAQGDAEMSPQRSGLYRRYELFVAWLLERRGMSVDELLAEPMDPLLIEREVLAAEVSR
ncbi:MAG TPA: hypothetical protein VM686_35415 [Polyangiaceae bacterium]|nr:hypothetical protein [Polyangiaceae bacterium]